MQNKLFKISVSDGLGFYGGSTSFASYTCIVFIALPSDWTENGKLALNSKEKILQKMYGEDWRNGNGDGSFYVVSKFLSEEVNAADTPWKKYENNKDFRCWFWEVKEGVIVEVKPEQFL